MICGKVIHKSRTAAVKHIQGVYKGNRPHNTLSNAYYCEDCKGWHTASKSVKAKKNIKPSGSTEDLSKPIDPLRRGFLVIKNFSSKKP
jgi:hypothetical protein